VSLTFDKGDNLYVEGSIEQRQFTPKNGVQRTVTDIVVKRCHLIATPRNGKATKPAEEAPPVHGHAVEHEGGPIHDDAWPVR
jgi:single-strand DNA-binding protein